MVHPCWVLGEDAWRGGAPRTGFSSRRTASTQHEAKGLLNMNLHRLLAALAALTLVAAGCGTYDERGERGERGQTLSPGNSAVDHAREQYAALRGISGESPSTLGARHREQVRSTTRGKPFSVHPV